MCEPLLGARPDLLQFRILPPRRALSFLNLVEAHVLAAIRRQHHVPLPKVRQALVYVSKKMDTHRPLAESEFQTDGVDLFLEKLGSLVNVTREGQTEMKDVIRDHLKRIERDTQASRCVCFCLPARTTFGISRLRWSSIRALPLAVRFWRDVRSRQPSWLTVLKRATH
jgi:hypothetical protein